MVSEKKPIFSNVYVYGNLYPDYRYAPFGEAVWVWICTDKCGRKHFCVFVDNDTTPFFLIKRINQARLTSFHYGYSTVLETLMGGNVIVKVTSSDLVNWSKGEVFQSSELDSLTDILNVHVPYRY